jgi:probable HAF family extracellular repeat protein
MEHAAVSADGSVVVGSHQSAAGIEAFRWMSDGTIEGLGDLPGGLFSSAAFDVSADGNVVVGVSSTVSDNQTVGQAFRWTPQTTMIAIAEPGTGARAISADGSVIVGVSNTGGGFRLPELPGRPPFNLPGSFDVVPRAVSSDGAVVVGGSNFRVGIGGFRTDAFRWTEAGGSMDLGVANSIANDVSGDGSVVVGGRLVPGAFYWTAETGSLNLQELLLSLGASNLDGWNLGDAEGITPDGLTIVGTGIDPSGSTQAWVATIPEPDSILLAALAAAGMLLVALFSRLAQKLVLTGNM